MRRTLAALLLLVVPTVFATMQPIAGVATTMEIVKAGSGPTVAARDTVTVHGASSPLAPDPVPHVRFSLEGVTTHPAFSIEQVIHVDDTTSNRVVVSENAPMLTPPRSLPLSQPRERWSRP
jgi:hypothetical protein